MGRAGKTYVTFNRVRLALFIRSYAGYSIRDHLRHRYKIHDRTTNTQLKKRFLNKRATSEISRLSRALNLNYQLLWQFIMLNKTQRLNTKISVQEKIKIYLEIENEIITLKIARQDKESLIEEDYEHATLCPAIERAAGNSLRAIDDDFAFEEQLEELQRKYRRLYYKTAYEYKLPTPRIVPFILRLLSD